jgi:GTP-binding protein
MRAERSIRRADVCILVIDLTIGVTAQDKRIAGLIQKARKAAIIILNKWDLVKPRRGEKQSARELIEETFSRIFFLKYSPVLITSASTGENVDRLFAKIHKVQHAARKRIGTGVLNRLLRQAFEANPPPLAKGRRLKLFYATQPRDGGLHFAEGPSSKRSSDKLRGDLAPPEFVLFVNDPQLMTEAYRRYLEARIREAEPYPGLPIILTLRARARDVGRR